jgi:predicted nucleotide-binding protein
MSDEVAKDVRRVINAKLHELTVIHEALTGDPPQGAREFEDWEEVLYHDLGPFLARPPSEVFAQATRHSNLLERRSAYVVLLKHLLATVAKEPAIVLRPIPEGTVFIVHGHDEENLNRLQLLLSKDFRLRPVVMKEEPGAAKTLIEKLEALTPGVKFTFVLWTDDDEVKGKDRERGQPRPNVLIELGYFVGKLGRDRVCVLVKGSMDNVPTDLLGVHYHAFTDNVKDLAFMIERELREAHLIP